MARRTAYFKRLWPHLLDSPLGSQPVDEEEVLEGTEPFSLPLPQRQAGVHKSHGPISSPLSHLDEYIGAVWHVQPMRLLVSAVPVVGPMVADVKETQGDLMQVSLQGVPPLPLKPLPLCTLNNRNEYCMLSQ